MSYFNSRGTGFGHGPFGKGKFGKASAGDNMVIRSFPAVYIEDDENRLLQHFLVTIKDRVDTVKAGIDDLPNQVDPLKVRDDILRSLGRTIDVEIDEAEPTEFRRSLVNNAVLFYRIKGKRDAYRIRGKISGFDVNVLNLYHFDPSYLPYVDPNTISELPAGSGELFTTQEPGSVSGIPSVQGCGYCFTSFIKITFTLVKSLPAATGVNYLDRVIRKLQEIIPIHVRDILFEIVINILIDENQYLDFGTPLQEIDLFMPVNMFDNFDVVPADVIPTDRRGYVQGTIETI